MEFSVLKSSKTFVIDLNGNIMVMHLSGPSVDKISYSETAILSLIWSNFDTKKQDADTMAALQDTQVSIISVK